MDKVPGPHSFYFNLMLTVKNSINFCKLDPKMVRPESVWAFLLILSITWHSIAQALHNSYATTSSMAIALSTQEDPSFGMTLDTINTLNFDPSSVYVTQHTALTKRGERANLVPCKILQRHQHFVIYPSVLTVNAIVGFWQKVALETIYKAVSEAPNALLTFTQGQLQATFSCMGTTIPWNTVHDMALRVIQSVNMGWVDTFDAVYEEASGAFTLWVSFHVLVNKPERKRKSPG